MNSEKCIIRVYIDYAIHSKKDSVLVSDFTNHIKPIIHKIDFVEFDSSNTVSTGENTFYEIRRKIEYSDICVNITSVAISMYERSSLSVEFILFAKPCIPFMVIFFDSNSHILLYQNPSPNILSPLLYFPS